MSRSSRRGNKDLDLSKPVALVALSVMEKAARCRLLEIVNSSSRSSGLSKRHGLSAASSSRQPNG